MISFNAQKGWLLPTFFMLVYCYSSFSISSEYEERFVNLSSHPQWLRLLHVKNGLPRITDKRFVLSSDNFSPLRELTLTYQLFYKDFSAAYCRFPARYLFLKANTMLDVPEGFHESECSEWYRYKSSVPFSEVSLVYASEVLSSASSMMGHTLLKVSGENKKGNLVSHSVSFFSEISTFNPFSLIYDGVIGGMEGFFLVRPFKIDEDRYLNEEQRNLWSYSLNMSEFDKSLIQAHIWELKGLDIQYLFQSYNCATLTLNILSLGHPTLLDEEILYVSPADVVKAISKKGLIAKRDVNLSDSWAATMFREQIDSKIRESIDSALIGKEALSFQGLSEEQRIIAQRYLSSLLTTPSIQNQLSPARRKYLTSFISESSTLKIDLNAYKDPLKTRQDSSFSSTLAYQDHQSFIELGFLPAARHLYSDNRQYFSESELKIAELVFRANLESSNIKLQAATLYSVRSLLPSYSNKPALSGEFYMGYRQRVERDLSDVGVFEISGGVGKTYRVSSDINVYGMLGAGVGTSINNTFIFVEPKMGAIVNLIYDAKLLIENKWTVGQFDSSKVLPSTRLDIAWYGMKRNTIRLAFESSTSRDIRRNTGSVRLDYEF